MPKAPTGVTVILTGIVLALSLSILWWPHTTPSRPEASYAPEPYITGQPSEPRAWDSYRAFLWQHADLPRTETLAQALRALGVTGANVYDHQPGSDWAARAGLSFYVDSAAGKGDLYLARDEWQQAWDQYWATRDPAYFARPRCLSDPAVLRRLKDRIRETVRLHKAHGPLAYALDDEISITTFANPFDFCLSEYCLARFRTWLQQRYTTVEALNRIWDTRFTAWKEVQPFTTDAIRAREFARAPEAYNFAPWADHRTFMDDVLADTLKALIAYARQLDPSTPVGFTGGQAPSAFGGYDWWKLMQITDFLEPYDLGGSREIIRSFNARHIPIVQTLFVQATPPHDMIWRLWYYLAHGDRGVILWSSREYFEDHDPQRPSAHAKALTATLRELGDIEAVGAVSRLPMDTDGIALYYSQPSLQAHWMLDSKADGATWPKRFSSFEMTHSSILKTMQAWQQLLEDLGFQYDYVSAPQVVEGVLQRKPYRVLILPKTVALSDAEAAAIEAFARRGGVVIADYQTGWMDEHARSRGVGALDALFGIRRSDRRVHEHYGDLDPLWPLRAGQFMTLPVMEPGLSAVAAKARGSARGTPCALVRTVERGAAVYLNLGILRYAAARFESGGGEEIRRWMRDLLREFGLSPRLTVTQDGREVTHCERIFYRGADRRYLFIVLNQLDVYDPGRTRDLTPRRISIQLNFAEPVRLTNLRTRRVLGHGATFTDDFVTHEANLYELTP